MSSGWLVTVDREVGEMCFVHAATGERVWELPGGITASGIAITTDPAMDGLQDEGAPFERVFAKDGFLLKAPKSTGRWLKRWIVADRVARTITW